MFVENEADLVNPTHYEVNIFTKKQVTWRNLLEDKFYECLVVEVATKNSDLKHIFVKAAL